MLETYNRGQSTGIFIVFAISNLAAIPACGFGGEGAGTLAHSEEAPSGGAEDSDDETQVRPIEFPGIYGPGVSGDSMANTKLGGCASAPHTPPDCLLSPTRKVFMRFRAEHSSPIHTATFYYVGPHGIEGADYSGYAGGRGCPLKVSLYPDDDNFPDTTKDPLVELVELDSELALTRKVDRKMTFPQSGFAMEKGKIYHLVFENIDPNPLSNYCSLESLIRHIPMGHPGEEGPASPRFPDSKNWGHGYFNDWSGKWVERENFLPILEVTYANGKSHGMSYQEISYDCWDTPGCSNESLVGEISGPSKMIREQFAVSGGDQIVTGVGIRLLKVSGTTSDLFLSLRDQADNEIDTITIPASSVAIGPSGPPSSPDYEGSCGPYDSPTPCSWDRFGYRARWVSGDFGQRHLLESGKRYSLRISSPGGTYWAWVMRSLNVIYDYDDVTAFSQGSAEYTVNGGLSYEGLGRVGIGGNYDLQFYFKTVSFSSPED